MRHSACFIRLRSLSPCLFALAVLLVSPAKAQGDDFAGEFEGEGLHLQLELEDGLYLGAIQMADDVFLCEARRQGSGLVGTFATEDGEYPFELRQEGGGLVLSSGGAAYNLRRIGGGGNGGNPLAGGGTRSNPLAGGGSTEPGVGPGRSAETGLAGRYQGSIQGTPAILDLELQGSRLTGRIDAGGYFYDLQGQVSGDQVSAQCSDPQTGGAFPCELRSSGDMVTLVLIAQDSFSGQRQEIPLTFRRQGMGSVPGVPGGDFGGLRGGAGSGNSVPAGQRDPALVGVWRQSESMSGGGASMVVENFLTINGDGTFTLGGGRAVGGGAGWGGDTGTGGVEEQGYWKSENRIVYVQSPGAGQWQPYARYYVEPQKLMFTFGDGSRQILYRVR